MSPSAENDWSIEKELQLAVSRTEVRFAWFRIAFCCLILLIFLLNNPSDKHNFGPRAALEVGIAALGIAISLLILALSGRRPLREIDLRLSVCADAVICTGGLMTNTIAPSLDYVGVFGTLDVAAVLLVILGTIFRASWVAVLLAGLLNLAGLGLIVWLDTAHGIQPHWGKVRLFGLYLVGALAISAFATARVRRALQRFSEAAMTAERARNSVELLLRDQHDLKSGLFDIGLRVELLAESPEENLNQTLKKIAARISGFGTSFEKSQFRSLSVLRGLTTPELASVTSAIAHAQRALSDSSSIEVIVGSIAPGTSVVFGGGTEGLGLLLTHLFENALGGDGRTGARHMWIGIVPESVGVVLTLEDDGPGFPPEQLKDLGSGPTRLGAKPHSSGLGLWLASRAVEAAGGRIQFDNRSVGGARIEITLAYAETEVPPPPQTKLRPASV